MKYVFIFTASLALLLLAGVGIGIIGFHYPRVVQNQPLNHPSKITDVRGTKLFLQDGQIIALDAIYASEISNKLSQSDFEVDIEGDNTGPVAIYARQNGFVCGTPWAQPIRIPLIPDTVYKNRRELIALGDYVQPNSQPDLAADGSQPVGSSTNRTPATAGSGR